MSSLFVLLTLAIGAIQAQESERVSSVTDYSAYARRNVILLEGK